MEWLETFEIAKNKALEVSASDSTRLAIGGIDPAFAITPPSIPEFAAKANEGDDFVSTSFDRSGTLPVPLSDNNLASRSSFDVVGNPRRSMATRDEGESSRDH